MAGRVEGNTGLCAGVGEPQWMEEHYKGGLYFKYLSEKTDFFLQFLYNETIECVIKTTLYKTIRFGRLHVFRLVVLQFGNLRLVLASKLYISMKAS